MRVTQIIRSFPSSRVTDKYGECITGFELSAVILGRKK